MVADDSNYVRLSEGTAAAFARVECKTTFGDVVRKWKSAIVESARAPMATQFQEF